MRLIGNSGLSPKWICAFWEAHSVQCVVPRKDSIKVKAIQVFSEKRARKWIWIGLAAFVALRTYIVQEMLVALVLFTIAFVVFAIVALVLYVVDSAGQWGLGWAGQHSGPAIERARRGLVLVEDLRKKSFRRPRSEPVR
jgi:hypothetical protein